MPRTTPSTVADGNDVSVPFEHVAKFMRQLSHDLRNNLGSMDLQAAFISELVTDADASTELKKLRSLITGTAKTLQAVSGSFWVQTPNLIAFPARMFVEDFRERLQKQQPDAPAVDWAVELGDEMISIDIEMVFSAVAELFRNAFHFHESKEPLTARATREDGTFSLELRECHPVVDTPPHTWGEAPLISTRRAGYGLGLFHARQILSAHEGDIEFSHDAAAGTVTTHVRLPLTHADADE